MRIRQVFLGVSVLTVAGALVGTVACGGADNRDTDRTSLAAEQTTSPMFFDSTVAVIPTSGTAKGGKVSGEEVFSNCVACHQSTGLGMPGAFPPLAGSEWLVNNPQVPIRIVLRGLQGQVTVKGASFNGSMPAWADQLSDAQIAAVLSYERSSWGNQAAPISEADVAAERKTTQGHAPWSPGDLQGLIHGGK